MEDLRHDELDDLEQIMNLPKGSFNSIPPYARAEAAKAISNVLYMERNSIFRPGLYYIVLADLCGNTNFISKYGNINGDIRVKWFQTSAIQSIGKIRLSNYATFNKSIGDAALLIFSSIKDVINWSEMFSKLLRSYDREYAYAVYTQESEIPKGNVTEIPQQIEDFTLRARRLVHLGEVRYAAISDPLSLAVNQIFKMEKEFSDTKLGCTQIVAETVMPTLRDLGYTLEKNKNIMIFGDSHETMTYYVIPN